MLKKSNISFEYVTTAIIIIVIIDVIGGITYKTSSKPNPNKILSQSAKHAMVNDQYIIAFSGHGNSDQIIDLREGIAQYKITYSCNSGFNVLFIDQKGKVIDAISGPAVEKTLNKDFTVSATGQYVMNIKCDGDWSFSRR